MINRIEKLQTILQKENIDAFIVDTPIDLYYLLEIDLSTGALIVFKNSAYLFVDGRYYENCKSRQDITVILSNTQDPESFLQQKENQVVGFCSEKTSYKKYLILKEKIKNLIPCADFVSLLRMIKDEHEIDLLRQAAKLGAQGFHFVHSLLREGISESEIALELEIFWRRQGGEKVAFQPIIAFGSNSSMPHYRAGKKCLKKDEIVLIDIGVTLRHYHSDMTRVIFFGKASSELETIFHIVEKAKKAALSICRPGTPVGQLDQAARQIIAEKGYGDHFTHSTGHGIGLEVHEMPTVKNRAPFDTMPLEAGMVVTIEPGIYIAGLGGVRLEDTILITENGYQNLTEEFLNSAPH
jgi:Xaa-Pro aminopeptidase